MIRNFKRQLAKDIFDGIESQFTRRIPLQLHEKIRRLCDQMNAATEIATLRAPPGNNLEKLKGNLNGYWSVRVNKQWRIIFKWENGEAFDVDIVDYH
jgi:proteic killer suppression protein